MDVFVGLLVLAALIAIPVGLFRPKAILWKAANPTRSQATAITVTSFAVLLGVWVSLLPQPPKTTAVSAATIDVVSAPAQAAKPKTIGVDYAELRGFMAGMGFEQKLGTPVNGLDNVVGNAKGAISQIVGGTVGVASVGIIMIVDHTDEPGNMRNALRMSSLIDKTLPGWKGGFDWLSAAMGKGGDTLVRDGKVVSLTITKEIGSISLSIKPAN